MKKSIFLLSGLLLSAALVSCNYSIHEDLNLVEQSVLLENSKLKGLVAKSNLSSEDSVKLTFSSEDWMNYCTTRDYSKLTETKLIDEINEKIKVLDIPSYDSVDIKRIKDDFPKLSDEEILENKDDIFRIYQNQISILIDKEYGKPANLSKYDYDNLTPEVISVMLTYPLNAARVLTLRDYAFEFTSKYMPGHYAEGCTRTDAFRHSIFVIILAKEGVGSFNEKVDWAIRFTDAMEVGGGYTRYDSEMDVHNNHVGINYYMANPYVSYDVACSHMQSKANSAVLLDKETMSIEEYQSRILTIDGETLMYDSNKPNLVLN